MERKTIKELNEWIDQCNHGLTKDFPIIAYEGWCDSEDEEMSPMTVIDRGSILPGRIIKNVWVPVRIMQELRDEVTEWGYDIYITNV